MRWPWTPKGPSMEDLRLAEEDERQHRVRARAAELDRQAAERMRQAEDLAYREESARQARAAMARQDAEWARQAQEAADRAAQAKVDRLMRGELPYDPPPEPKAPPVEVFIRNPMPPMHGSMHYGYGGAMGTGAFHHRHYYY